MPLFGGTTISIKPDTTCHEITRRRSVPGTTMQLNMILSIAVQDPQPASLRKYGVPDEQLPSTPLCRLLLYLLPDYPAQGLLPP